MSETKKRSRWTTALLVILPLWLAVSAVIALMLYFKEEEAQAQLAQERYTQPISSPAIADDLRKIVELIGERNTSSEPAKAALRSMGSMIQGILGPSNTGYSVSTERGPAGFPLIHAAIPGKSRTAPAVWLVTGYDSPQGSRGAERNASGTAATLAVAQAMAADEPHLPVRFVFLPHVQDAAAPLDRTLEVLEELIMENGGATAILCVETMAGGEALWLLSEGVVFTDLETLVRPVSQEEIAASPLSLARRLADAGLPAAHVTTRAALSPGEPDERTPFSGTVAMSAGALMDLVRHLARPPLNR